MSGTFDRIRTRASALLPESDSKWLAGEIDSVLAAAVADGVPFDPAPAALGPAAVDLHDMFELASLTTSYSAYPDSKRLFLLLSTLSATESPRWSVSAGLDHPGEGPSRGRGRVQRFWHLTFFRSGADQAHPEVTCRFHMPDCAPKSQWRALAAGQVGTRITSGDDHVCQELKVMAGGRLQLTEGDASNAAPYVKCSIPLADVAEQLSTILDTAEKNDWEFEDSGEVHWKWANARTGPAPTDK